MTRVIIKYRWWIIGTCILAGIGFAAVIPFSETDPEIRNYVPSSLESRRKTDTIEKNFGTQDMVVVMFTDSCILNAPGLRQIKSVERELSRISGISDIISPFTIKAIKGEGGALVAEPLLKSVPVSRQEKENLEKRIKENRMAAEVVISSDFTTANITATINSNDAERTTLGRIDSAIARASCPAVIQTGGLPYIRRFILKDVRRDAVFIVPLALIIMLFILKSTLGEWKRVLMPFAVVVLSTCISMGLVPLMGWKISIITLLVPIILVAVANNYGIYLVTRHSEMETSANLSNGDLLRKITGSLNMPILFSGLTTIAGILGLLTHSIIPARQVGILSATGVTIALLMSLLFVPALLYIKGPSRQGNEQNHRAGRHFEKLPGSLAAVIVRFPGRILLTSLIFIMVISTGALYLKIDTNQENYFPQKHPARKAASVINSKFGGSQTISVMIDGDIKEPDVMGRIDRLTSRLEEREGVGMVFSISNAVREISKAVFMPSEPGYDKIPESREGIAQLFELYYMSGDQGDFDRLINPENTKAHLMIRLSNPENRVIRGLERLIESETEGINGNVTSGGYAIIMADFAESVIRGQVYSLAFAVIIVWLLLSIIFKSFRGGLIGTIPLAASILILFGFMGFTGIALDSATALLSSIMIGVGVDFTIQYMWCYNAMLRRGLEPAEATSTALHTIGKSIIINAFSVMAGFSALIFSGFMSIRFFGYLVIISIGACLVGAIIFIPAFLLKFKPMFISKDLTWKKNRKYEKKDELIPASAAAFSGTGSAA